MPNLTLVTPPAIEPLILEDAKNYLRLETDEDDTLVADLISAARMECEHRTGRSFLTTTWRFTLDPRGGSIQLPRPPLIEVLSIQSGDQVGLESSYLISPGSPGRISPRWPNHHPVEITYTAGYGTSPSSVPRNIIAAMRLLVAHYWSCRVEAQPEPPAINNLLSISAWPVYS